MCAAIVLAGLVLCAVVVGLLALIFAAYMAETVTTSANWDGDNESG